jgi:hypothetical protein
VSTKQDAAFEAGFATARGDELPTELENTEETSTESTEDAEATAEVSSLVDEVEAPEEKPAPTQDDILRELSKIPELETLTKSEVRKIYGKFGEIQQALSAMQGQSSGRGKLKVTEAMKNEYPELAEMMEGFEIEGAGGSGANIEQELNVRVEAVKQDFETKLLTMQHKDWREVAQTPAFVEWVGKQDPDTQDKLANSWDALFISEKLTEFKSTTKVAETKNTNKASRLEDAITPSSRSSVKPRVESEDDAFASGFSKVRGIAA